MNEPTPIQDHIPDARLIRCPGCGAVLSQARMEGVWQPEKCGMCRQKEDAAILPPHPHSREAHIEARLRALNVPPLYEGAALDTLESYGTPIHRDRQARILGSARRFLRLWEESPRKVPTLTLFLGAPGTGKGHIAWSLAKAVVKLYAARAIVEVFSNVVDDLTAQWGNTGAPAGRTIGDYRAADLLVLDEVSTHAMFGVQHARRHLYKLLAFREQWLRPTILTSNDDLGTIEADVLGPALTSRLARWGGVWDFGNEDYRLVQRERDRRAGDT